MTERGQVLLPNGQIVDEDEVVTYEGAFETITIPAWQLVSNYLKKETYKWINTISDQEAIEIVNKHNGSGTAIAALFKEKVSGFDWNSDEIWKLLPDTSEAKVKAAFYWLWDKYDLGWEIADFKGAA